MRIVCLIAFSFFAALNSFAANVYVRDGAAGTGLSWSDALDDLPANLTRDNTYYLADGVYGDHTFDEPLDGTKLITIKKATESDHGTETGWDSSYGDGEAIFEGRAWTFGATGGTYGYITIDGGFSGGRNHLGYGIRVRSTAAENRSNTVLVFMGGDVVALNSTTIRNVSFDFNDGQAAIDTDIGGAIIFFSPVNDLTIQDCSIYKSTGLAIQLRDDTQGGNPWTNRGASSNVLIERVYMRDIGGGGGPAAHWELTWITQVAGLVIRYCTVENVYGPVNGQTGWFMIGACDGVKYYGNLVFCVPGATQDGQSTAVGNDGLFSRWVGLAGYENTAVELYNSDFINLPANAHGNQDDADTFVLRNNFYYTAAFSWSGVTTRSHEAFGGGVTAGGTSAQSGLDSSIFVNYSANTVAGFHLAAATSAGTTLASPYDVDADGEVRGADGTWDRGAFEYDSGGGGTSGGGAGTVNTSVLRVGTIRVAP